MDLYSRLDELQGDASLGLLFVSSTGVLVLEPPSAFDSFEFETLRPDFPLDIAAVESQGEIATTFVAALTDGYAMTLARHADGDLRSVEMYNEIDKHGCVVTVVISTDQEPASRAAPELAKLPVRRAEMRFDAAGRVLSVGSDFEAMFGFSAESVRGSAGGERVHPDDSLLNTENWATALSAPGQAARVRQRTLCLDGSWLWGEWTVYNRLHLDDPHMFAEAIDIHGEMQAQVALEQREALLVRLTEALPVGVVQLLTGDVVSLSNQRWTELTGQPSLSIGATTHAEPVPAFERVFDAFRNAAEVEEICKTVRATGDDASIRVYIADDSSACTHGDLQVRNLRDEAGDLTLLLALTDVSEAVALQARLQFEARNDHLTNILNRHGLEERIDELLRSTDAVEHELVMLYLDLDGFKAVNDLCGHHRGDEVLQQLAVRLSDLVRDNDLIGRVGGDEFVVIAQVESQAEAEAMQRRVQSRLRIEVLEPAGSSILVTASVGMAIAEKGDTFSSLSHRADAAMYRFKDRRGTDPT